VKSRQNRLKMRFLKVFEKVLRFLGGLKSLKSEPIFDFWHLGKGRLYKFSCFLKV
jgi:hypothetical protein